MLVTAHNEKTLKTLPLDGNGTNKKHVLRSFENDFTYNKALAAASQNP
jgi:hypothetical protein